jgi:hypothetical protein
MDFNNTTLYDPVSQKFWGTVNSGDATSVTLSSLGYHMDQEQYLVGAGIPVNTDSSGFSFSFWLYPVNPGQVLNTTTGLFEALRMPVIIFSDTTGVFDETFLSVYENTNSDGTNKIELKIWSYDEYGAIDTAYTVYSDSYEALMSHHFFFNISVEKNEIEVYIDGVLSSLNGEEGSLPSSFEHIELDMAVNKIFETEYAYNLSNNLGIIDDIGFFNLQFDAESILPKLINEGLEEFADLDLRNEEDFLQGSVFDDPTTLTVNAMIDDMSYVYLARNDGKILFGSPLLWESRKVFSDSREDALLDDFVVTENGTPATVVNGFLQITDSIIRL